MGYYQTCAIPKGASRKTLKGRKRRLQHRVVVDVRTWVFARDRGICRCCRERAATELHELTFRSLGGTVSRRNSIAVDATCHGHLQAHRIRCECQTPDRAEGMLAFDPQTDAARDWMKLPLGQVLLSEPLRDLEERC